MIRRLLGLTIAVALVTHAPARSQGLVLDTFREYLESLRTQARIPGLAVGVIGRNQLLWEQAFGEQDIARASAARTDTPFHLDGVAQIFTAALVLRCVEDGRLSLDDPIGQFTPDGPEAGSSIRELLTHTTPGERGLQFRYRPERLDPLMEVVRACTGHSYREALGRVFNRLGMANSVPGPDVMEAPASEFGLPANRYRTVLDRLATPYRVDREERFIESRHPVTTLTASAGLITSVEDFAWFDLELKNGLLLRDETLDLAWSPPLAGNGSPLEHGYGWFVEQYRGRQVVWQFGVTEDASSSLVVTLPEEGLTLVVLANGDGLARPFTLSEGGVTQSPFARLFLELFVR